MAHPLTQLKFWKLVENVAQTTDWNDCDEYEDVLYARAVADWQLEQVIEWLEKNLIKQDYILYLWDETAEIKKDELIAHLKQTMRPQQQEDN